MRHDMSRIAAALVGLCLLLGCEQPDYSGASFKPAPPEKDPGRLTLLVFEPGSRRVPWGDDAFYHRESRAAAGASPVEFTARLDGAAPVRSQKGGALALTIPSGPHGLEVALPGRTARALVRVSPRQMSVQLWSLEGGGRLLAVAGTYPASDLAAAAVAELSALLPPLRSFLAGLDTALAAGDEARIDRLLAPDFRDPLGGKGDFTRALVYASRAGHAVRRVGDAWVDQDGAVLRVRVGIERGGLRTFPTLDLEASPSGPGGYRVRSWY